jgi:hypothetical protein
MAYGKLMWAADRSISFRHPDIEKDKEYLSSKNYSDLDVMQTGIASQRNSDKERR